ELENCVSWWIGDWWAFGEHRYGSRKALVEADNWRGPAYQTCANAASVCRSFEPSRRREVLSFTHHAKVAGDDNADALLDWCEEAILETGKPRSVRALHEERERRRIVVLNMALRKDARAQVADEPILITHRITTSTVHSEPGVIHMAPITSS